MSCACHVGAHWLILLFRDFKIWIPQSHSYGLRIQKLLILFRLIATRQNAAIKSQVNTTTLTRSFFSEHHAIMENEGTSSIIVQY